MKRKNIAFLDIVVVLCSVFLVAPLPCIAADQSTQEVSATTTSEDDFTLDIYGNANEDDTIDIQDVTYIKRIISGEEDETNLADAYYDGEIDVGDIIQTKLIILGKERELTVIDAADRTVTINMPIERTLAAGNTFQDVRTICALGAADKIVGMCDYFYELDWEDYFVVLQKAYPELLELPSIGDSYTPSIESIASLEPDLVIASNPELANTIQETTNIPTVYADYTSALTLEFEYYKFMGYVLGEQERADELSSYLNEKIAKVSEVTSDIPDDEKPKVYLAFWTFMGAITYTPFVYAPVEVAGGINVAEDVLPGLGGPLMWQVSKEQIIAWNPDIILLHCAGGPLLFSINDVLSDPDLQSVSAVQNETVYSTTGFSWGWDPATGVNECFYMAKLFHPEEFADVDVGTVGNEIFEEVYGTDGLWTEITEKCNLKTWE
jgi:iron complex transport system substrate-binding protein